REQRGGSGPGAARQSDDGGCAGDDGSHLRNEEERQGVGVSSRIPPRLSRLRLRKPNTLGLRSRKRQLRENSFLYSQRSRRLHLFIIQRIRNHPTHRRWIRYRLRHIGKILAQQLFALD